MTQLIAYCAKEGILVCTDSAAVVFDGEEVCNHFTVQKLFKLTPHILLATAGAGYGIALCQALEEQIRTKGLWDFEDILRLSIPYFRSQSQRLKQEYDLSTLHPEVSKLYFILAGYLPGEQTNPFRLVTIASDSPDSPLSILKIRHFVLIPRRLGIEYKLNLMPMEQTNLDEIEKICDQFFHKLAAKTDDVFNAL